MVEHMRFAPVQLDRAAGVLVEAAAGDALGAGYEFGAKVTPEAVTMRPGSLTGRSAGSWTDDTDMAIAIARVAAEGVRLDEAPGLDRVAAGFLEWYSSHPPDIGVQTNAVLSGASGPADLARASATYAATHSKSAGNGSLMRTGPVALAHLGDDEGLVRAAGLVSALTHDDPLAKEACAIWCVAIDRAVRDGRLDGIYEGIALLPDERREFWAERITEAEQADPEVIRWNTFVVTALQAAWWAIWSTRDQMGPPHLQAALRAAVGIGDDTDTVAAIAGALLGARYGASAVPFTWRRRLRGWPAAMRHADLVGLGVLAARGGETDGSGWPLEPDLWPTYQREFHPRGQVTILDEDPGIQWGDVAGLADADADAFISLCRIGPAQRRGEDHFEIWLVDEDGTEANADARYVLADTADAITQLRAEGKRVFVHCVRAESRTPSVAGAWLVRSRHMPPTAAIAAVEDAMSGVALRPSLRASIDSLASV